MSVFGPHRAEGKRRFDDRFGFEAMAVAGLLVALTIASISLGTEAGWRRLASARSERDIAADLSGGAVSRGADRVLVGADGGRRPTARLPLLELEPGSIYLLRIRVGPGNGFAVQGFDRRSRERVYIRFPARRTTAAYARQIGFGPRSAELRLTLVSSGGAPLEIHEMTLSRMSPARRAAVGALPWIGALAIVIFAWRHRRRLRAALTDPRPTDDIVFSGVLVVALSWGFLAAPVQQVMDGRLATLVSYSLLHEGTIAVPREYVPRELAEYRIRPFAGRLYHYAYTPVAVLNTPFVWLFERMGVSPMRGGVFDSAAEIGILRWIAALLAASLCAVLYRLGRLWLTPRWSLALTIAFAFGTQILSSVSRPFWSHGWAVLLSALAIYLLLAPKHRDRRVSVLCAAALLATASLCRPVLVLSAAAGVALLWIRPRSSQRWLGLGLGVAALLVGAMALVAGLGRFILPHRLDLSGPPGGMVVASATGLAGTLISPARGLLLFIPFFAWIVWAVLRRWSRVASTGVASVALAAIVAHWLVLVGTRVWPDGQAFGPRLFSDVIVWFFLLGALAVRAVLDSPQSRRRRAEVGIAVACLAVSIFVNARGAVSPATWHWHWLERRPGWMIEGGKPRLEPPSVWNWRNPQFLAGILRREPGFEERLELTHDYIAD